MTAAPRAGIAAAPSLRVALRIAGLLVALGAIVGARWAATVGGVGDALTIGLVFGLALTALAILASERVALPRPAALAIGAAGGAALVGLALLAHLGSVGPSFAPAAAFLPWALITILVATAEELILRGALFVAIQRHAGVAAAVTVTSLAFALMHVPLYGWHVVPLDLGVGIWLGGLRLLGRGAAAPAVAHALADLVTWWL
ncbi:MAG TPA: CPBP family intramembrane glutamic endopeptidase [Candidatus Limnocylindrales bacterium]|nr:CPBP family intramembrane glutamic endopeptidase [Candidatus Limnocylindrales bacterium]